MLYPVFSYNDGTEVTASKPNKDGEILLYVEKFDEEKDEFINATFILPGPEVKTSYGYSEKDIENLKNAYSEIQDDIIDYIMDKVKKSA